MSPLPRFVLDTNIVLDWLVFRDSSLADLDRAVSERRLELVAHQPALDELRRVLSYPQCKVAELERGNLLEQYRTRTLLATLPDGFGLNNLMLPAGFPRCRDPDDEHFLALSYHGRATLITRDKEILRLIRRARRFGVTILPPAQLSVGA